jgi:exopolysaccharide biosynthesis polyprenyl glycosylphosphotransferase
VGRSERLATASIRPGGGGDGSLPLPGVRARPGRTPDDVAWASILGLGLAQGADPNRFRYADGLKRAIDLAGAALLLLLLAPFLLAVAVAIRLDSPGPAIFRQRRVGRGGRQFTVYKFRTMTHAQGEGLVRFAGADGRLLHKVPDDPRITDLGRVLRRTSIDELPQLINVLRGEMSLVGPRPELPEIVAGYAPWQHRRHLVRPGLTGWWQVHARSELQMHENTELDLYYVDHLSFRLDLRILVETVHVVFFGYGAF